jgi:hypothetical protein
MHAKALIRVFCVDGPCHGIQYLDADTGRVLFDEEAERLGVWYIYRVSATELTHTDAGLDRNAHFEYAKPADTPGEHRDRTDDA